MAAIVLAFVLARQALNRSVERLLVGIGHPNIILMCLVCLLAGAFASVSDSIGSVDTTAPIAAGFAQDTGLSLPLAVAGVIAIAINRPRLHSLKQG